MFKYLFYFILATIGLPCRAQTTTEMSNVSESSLPCRFIYKIDVNAKSKRIDRNPPPEYKFALINHCPQSEEEQNMAVRVVPVIWQGKKNFYGLYRVERVFESADEAHAYALMNGVPMACLPQDEETVLYVPTLRENGLLPQDIRQDWVLQALEALLPDDWEMLQTDADKADYPSQIVLQAKYQVWKTNFNLINAPAHVIKQTTDEVFMRENGQLVTPFIRFSLHQPWSELELKMVDYNATNWMYYYANAQYYGLKVIALTGIGGEMEQVLLPQSVKTSPFQVYEKVRQFLTPQMVEGTAQNAKLGAVVVDKDGIPIYMDNRTGTWGAWPAEMQGKSVKVQGILLERENSSPLRNEKGEYSAGAEGKQLFLVRPVLAK